MLSKQDSFLFIDLNKDTYSVSLLAEASDVSRQGYAKWKKRQDHSAQDLKDEQMFHYISKVFAKSRGTYGRRRIKLALQREFGLTVNIKRISRIMRRYGLKCRIRRKGYRHGGTEGKVAQNLLKRNFKATKPMKKFSVDITYVRAFVPTEHWTYLCAIKDLYDDSIVAFAYGPNQDTGLVLEALEMLEKVKGNRKKAIIHSDQGSQFMSLRYQKRLQSMNLTPSMSRRGNCWDNACIESFFSHFKTEIVCFGDPRSLEELRISIEEYIYFYNHERLQLKHGVPPAEVGSVLAA